MSTSPPVPNPPVIWKVRHWFIVWGSGTAGGVVLAAAVSPMWQGDVLGSGFFFLVALPAQAIAQIIALTVVMLRFGRRLDRDLGFEIRLGDLRVAPLAFVNVVALSYLLNPILEHFDITEQTQAELELFGSATHAALFVGVMVAVGFAPIYEELLFRGMLQRALAGRLGRLPTMALTATIFGLVHIATVDPQIDQWPIHVALVVVSVGWLGFVLSWLVDRDGRLGRAIVFHSTHNLVVIAATLIAGADSLFT